MNFCFHCKLENCQVFLCQCPFPSSARCISCLLGNCHIALDKKEFCCTQCCPLHTPKKCRAIETKCLYSFHAFESTRCSAVHGFLRVVSDIPNMRFRVVPLCNFHVLNFEDESIPSGMVDCTRVYKCWYPRCLKKGLYQTNFINSEQPDDDNQRGFACFRHYILTESHEFKLNIVKEPSNEDEFQISAEHPTDFLDPNVYLELPVYFNGRRPRLTVHRQVEKDVVFFRKPDLSLHVFLKWKTEKWGKPPQVDMSVLVPWPPLLFGPAYKKRSKKFTCLLMKWLQQGHLEIITPILPKCVFCKRPGVMSNYVGNMNRNSSLYVQETQPFVKLLDKILIHFPIPILGLIAEFSEWIPSLFFINITEDDESWFEPQHIFKFEQTHDPFDYDLFSTNYWLCADCIEQEEIVPRNRRILPLMEQTRETYRC